MTEGKDEVQRIVADLVRLIKAAPDTVIHAIAYGDSYADEGDCQKSLTALKEVVEDLDCRLERQPNNHWNPREPIELIAYGVDGQSTHETVVANALLMISDLECGDYGYMDYRWNQAPGRDFFENLPPVYRDPLLAGFAVLRRRGEIG